MSEKVFESALPGKSSVTKVRGIDGEGKSSNIPVGDLFAPFFGELLSFKNEVNNSIRQIESNTISAISGIRTEVGNSLQQNIEQVQQITQEGKDYADGKVNKYASLVSYLGDTVDVEAENGFINTNGELTTGSDKYKVTDYIPVNVGMTYRITISGSIGTNGISAYDSSKNFIKSESIINDNTKRVINYTVADGVSFLRVCYNMTVSGNYEIITLGVVPRVVEDMIDSEVDVLITSGFIKSDGTYNAVSGAYKCTDFIEVKEGDTFRFGMSGSTGVYGLSAYTEKNQSTIIKGLCMLCSNCYERIEMIIPAGVNYIRITYNTSYQGDYSIQKAGSIATIEKKVDELKKDIGKVGNPGNYSRLMSKYPNIAPQKAVVCFQMDCNPNVITGNGTWDFANLISGIGGKATFFPFSNSFNMPEYVNLMKDLQDDGHEISIHTIPADGIGQTNPEPHPDANGLKTKANGYIRDFIANGLYPMGWVTSQGLMVPSLVPELNKYVGYAHTLANGSVKQHNPVNFVNNADTDRYKILRWGLEQYNDDSDNLTEETVINSAKAAIDKAVSDGGFVVFYTHTYNNFTNANYTLRENVLKSILAYLKPLIDAGIVITGNTADMVNIYYR